MLCCNKKQAVLVGIKSYCHESKTGFNDRAAPCIARCDAQGIVNLDYHSKQVILFTLRPFLLFCAGSYPICHRKKKEKRKADKTLEQITVRFAVGAGKSIGGVYL